MVANLYRPTSKLYKILAGITSLLLLISGISLFSEARLSYAPPYPLWIWGKMIAWAILAIFLPICVKRFSSITRKAGIGFLIVLLFAAYLGIFKTQ